MQRRSMTGARNVDANSSAVTDRRYSHPERSRGGSRCTSLHLPIVILLRQAKDFTYSVEITQSRLASSRPYVRSLSPSRTGVVFAVRDDERVRTGPLFRESSFV